MGFFFMVNLCLGTGFLGIPYSFFYSGYLAAVPTLLIIGFVSWLNSIWILEVMARAQVSHYTITCVFYVIVIIHKLYYYYNIIGYSF